MLVNGVFDVLGQGFIRLMQMLVVPLVFFSLVTGAMSMGDTKKLGKIGVKTLVFYLFTTALAITLALLLASFINIRISATFMFQTLGPSFMLDTCGDLDWFIDFSSLNLSIYVAYYHQNMVAYFFGIPVISRKCF